MLHLCYYSPGPIGKLIYSVMYYTGLVDQLICQVYNVKLMPVPCYQHWDGAGVKTCTVHPGVICYNNRSHSQCSFPSCVNPGSLLAIALHCEHRGDAGIETTSTLASTQEHNVRSVQSVRLLNFCKS